jgi:hypothetical protein
MRVLGDTHWGEGYCCKRCFETSDEYDPESHDGLPEPDDVRGMRRELARNADLTDALVQAAAIDARLPKIIYLRRRGMTLRKVAKECGICASQVRNIFAKCTPNILRICGL